MDLKKTEIFDQFYEMNPKTEFLIPNGTFLRDGMVVMLAHPRDRRPFPLPDGGEMSSWDEWRLAESNSWARISYVEIDEEIGAIVDFVATYSDGIQRMREYNLDTPWLVKKDSVPNEEPKEKETRGAVREIVRKISIFQDAETYHGNGFTNTEKYIDDVVEQIINLFTGKKIGE